jgi:AcrR family transcriptional regulator
MARGLNVDRVVAAAVELADEDGLAAVSMARVAERLGFTTMSLYRHVRNKDELVWRMLDRALGPAPEFAVPDWRAGMDRWARELRAAVKRHPWCIDVPITGELATFSQLSWLDRGLQALSSTGLELGEQAELVLLLNGYVFWAVRIEMSMAAAPPQPLIPVQIDLDAVPFVREAVNARAFEDEPDRDRDFNFGLERVLDGIGVLVDQRSSPRPVPPSLPRTSSK